MIRIPHTCVLCEARCQSRDLCNDCHDDLPWLTLCCDICGLPGISGICADCIARERPFSLVLAPLEYRFPIDNMITRFKQQQRLAIGEVLAEVMADCVRQNFAPIQEDNNLVTAVPLHRTKQTQRGFNQAAILADTLAKSLALPIALDVCRRLKQGPDLKHQSARERQRLIKGAFNAETVARDQRIILVDDVVTTCATISELSQTLRVAGAADVVVVAAARTPSQAV